MLHTIDTSVENMPSPVRYLARVFRCFGHLFSIPHCNFILWHRCTV